MQIILLFLISLLYSNPGLVYPKTHTNKEIKQSAAQG